MSSVIKIIRNESANCITFLGTSVPAYFNSCLSGEVDSVDTDLVNIKNDVRSQNATEDFFEFSNLHYSRFRDVDDNSFANAQEVADYISEIGNVITSDLGTFNIHVESGYTGNKVTGSLRYPYKDIQTAVDNALDGQSIQLKGNFIITSEIVLPTDKSLYFYGNEDTTIKYASYATTNGNIFKHEGDGSNKSFTFQKIKFYNSGEYGLLLKKTEAVNIRNCQFYNCAWDGTQLNTVLASATSGLLGYDSTDTDLQAFYAGIHASNGGAVRLEECRLPLIRESRAEGCLRAFRLQDCGINGGGFVIENRAVGNIESGFYLAVGALGGSQNITVAVNYSAYNANNGLLCIGGINNKFSQNEIKGNWNAGLCAWGSANLTLRDCGLYDNNRSEYNGIGNIGDAKASIQLNDAASFLATTFSLNTNSRFLYEILDTQIHYTGLGSSSSKIGVFINSNMGSIPDSDKNIIKIDDVGFIGQDYAIDFSEVDLTNLRVSLGDNSYQSIGIKTVNDPLNGDYFELPFSNHSMNLNEADFSVTNTGNIVLKEGVNGTVINPYSVNELKAEAYGPNVKVVLKDSHKIQFIVPVSGCTINGTSVNSILSEALLQLNNLFTNTAGFSGSGGNPVTNFALSGNNLTLTLQDGTSYTVDVTSLGVDENKFVSSGQLNGSNLELTMNDGSIITIDASNMVNGSTLPSVGQKWVVAYGPNSGNPVNSSVITNGNKDLLPFYYGANLKQGREFIWQHDVGGTLHIGLWGYTNSTTGTFGGDDSYWITKFRITNSLVAPSTGGGSYNTVGTDIDSRYATGYAVNQNTLFALRHDNNGYLSLFDISDSSYILIAKSNLPTALGEVPIHMVGQFNANTGITTKVPSLVERTEMWEVYHDLDNSQNDEWKDGVEEQTVLKSNIAISPGEKILLNINSTIPNGVEPKLGFDYSGATTGVSNAYTLVARRFKIEDNDGLQVEPGVWNYNTSATYYNSTLGTYRVALGTAIGMVEIRYNLDNSVDLYSQTHGEIIATLASNADGSDLNLFYAFADDLTGAKVWEISKQVMGQGSQPINTFAPDIANQIFSIVENLSFNSQIVLNTNSDIVTQFVEIDGPSWLTLDQKTGEFTGTAPAYTGTAADSYLVNCKAGNSVGGSTTFQVTFNVLEQTYVNTKSLFFEEGVNSFLGGNAALITALERSGTGAGSADAWTIQFVYKRGTSPQGQTLFYFGSNDTANNGFIEIKNTVTDRIRFRYGTTNNYLQIQTASGAIDTDWNWVLISYDGGTTGVADGSQTQYWSRFKIFINGVEQTNTSKSHQNFGWAGTIVGENFRFGKLVSGNYPRDVKLNSLTIWDSDQSSNANALYNGGIARDTLQLTASSGGLDANYENPDHHYEPETSVSIVSDLIGNAHLSGYAFSSADLVSDAPPIF